MPQENADLVLATSRQRKSNAVLVLELLHPTNTPQEGAPRSAMECLSAVLVPEVVHLTDYQPVNTEYLQFPKLVYFTTSRQQNN